MARERPTASDDQPVLPSRDAGVRTAVDVLTRAEARALSRCAPLSHAGHAQVAVVQSGRWAAPAERRHVGELRRQVTSFASSAGMSDDGLAELQVALSEALSNVVLHAYRDRDFAGDVQVNAEVAGSELCVRVRDYGAGLAARSDSPGMGLGLSIIARLSKRSSVHRCVGGGTEVGMRFDLARDAAPHADAGTALQ